MLIARMDQRAESLIGVANMAVFEATVVVVVVAEVAAKSLWLRGYLMVALQMMTCWC